MYTLMNRTFEYAADTTCNHHVKGIPSPEQLHHSFGLLRAPTNHYTQHTDIDVLYNTTQFPTGPIGGESFSDLNFPAQARTNRPPGAHQAPVVLYTPRSTVTKHGTPTTAK